MSIHKLMEEEKADGSLAELFGLDAAEPDAVGIAEVVEVLSDGECHTISTIHAYLQLVDVDLSGCEIGAILIRLADTHGLQAMPPYDYLGPPQRFKLPVAKGEA